MVATEQWGSGGKAKRLHLAKSDQTASEELEVGRPGNNWKDWNNENKPRGKWNGTIPTLRTAYYWEKFKTKKIIIEQVKQW